MARKMKANQKQVKKQKQMTQLQALSLALKALKYFADEDAQKNEQAYEAARHVRKLRDTLLRKQQNQAQYYKTRKRQEDQGQLTEEIEYQEPADITDENERGNEVA